MLLVTLIPTDPAEVGRGKSMASHTISDSTGVEVWCSICCLSVCLPCAMCRLTRLERKGLVRRQGCTLRSHSRCPLLLRGHMHTQASSDITRTHGRGERPKGKDYCRKETRSQLHGQDQVRQRVNQRLQGARVVYFRSKIGVPPGDCCADQLG